MSNTIQRRRLASPDTILRDAHQSLLATRMRTEDMLPICDKLDRVGYWSLEVWGGATFDACVRFLRKTRGNACASSRRRCPTPPADAPARAEPARLPPLQRRCGCAPSYWAAVNGIDVFRIFDAMTTCR